MIDTGLAGYDRERSIGEENGHRLGAARAIDLRFDVVVLVGGSVPFMAALELEPYRRGFEEYGLVRAEEDGSGGGG